MTRETSSGSSQVGTWPHPGSTTCWTRLGRIPSRSGRFRTRVSCSAQARVIGRLDPLQVLDPAGPHQRAGLVVGGGGDVGLSDRLGLAGTESLRAIDEPAERSASSSGGRHDRPQQGACRATAATRPGDRPVRRLRRSLPESCGAESHDRARATLASAFDRSPAAQGDPGHGRLAVDPERLEEVEHRCRQVGRARLDALRQLGRLPEPGHVDRDHLALGREPVHHGRPLNQRSAERMEQEQRLALTLPDVVQPVRRTPAGARAHRSRSYSTYVPASAPVRL